MKTDLLRKKIEATFKELRDARERIRVLPATEEDRALEKVRADLADVRSQIGTLESASPTELIRRGLTAEQAVSESDGLSKKAQQLAEREGTLSEKISRKQSDYASNVSLIRRLFLPATYQTEVLLRAEVAGLLLSVVDGSQIDIPWEMESGAFHHFVRSAVAIRIISDRQVLLKRRAESTEELIALLDEALQEPIPRLIRNPAVLPDDQNSMLTRTISQMILAS